MSSDVPSGVSELHRSPRQMGGDPSCLGFHGAHAELFVAVEALDSEAVRRALEAGADPNACGSGDETITSLALQWLSRSDRVPPILRQLIHAGADIDRPHLGANLGSAVRSDSVSVIEVIAECDPDWNAPMDYRLDGQIVTILDEVDETIALISRGHEDVKGPKRELDRIKLVREALVRLGAKCWRELCEKQSGEPGATDNPDDAQRLREDH